MFQHPLGKFQNADDPRGQSMNNGKTISVEPSWTVQGGHSGLQLQLEVPSAPIPFLYNVEHTTRLVGTRSGTHSHDFTAVTCAYQGEMTLLLDKVTRCQLNDTCQVLTQEIPLP